MVRRKVKEENQEERNFFPKPMIERGFFPGGESRVLTTRQLPSSLRLGLILTK
jgi:hypothetical protein